MQKGIVVDAAIIQSFSERKVQISRLRGIELSALHNRSHLLDIRITRVVEMARSGDIQPGLSKKRLARGQLSEKSFRLGILAKRSQNLRQVVLNP